MVTWILKLNKMALLFTEDTLKSLTKEKLIKLLQEKNNESLEALSKDMKEILGKFTKMEAEISSVRQENATLKCKMVELERQAASNSQYSRRESFELCGLPSSVTSDALETKVCQILSTIDVTIASDEIEAIHRLHDNNKVIVKLSKRKKWYEIFQNKNKLKNLDTSTLGFKRGTKIFINESLCPLYKKLWSISKRLFTEKEISSFYTLNGTVRIKIREGSVPIIITHMKDLEDLFPYFDFNKN